MLLRTSVRRTMMTCLASTPCFAVFLIYEVNAASTRLLKVEEHNPFPDHRWRDRRRDAALIRTYSVMGRQR
ncbi:hypothetical protein SERLA73DRAFT_186913 [Serpula lacrymans var. lacrymans S7.3]|uniref:Uncharacterized protein n=1 Tax=Serpula lacrymans var. lacrymans (strain S7.3) TaxID=936435 RepID=F8Q837_SERL3|nr:hypothetical protein SERLA73DRAFT_186913 [Serpula lacrymans var. lacrymans S7.3]